jgi:hypothetical protein
VRSDNLLINHFGVLKIGESRLLPTPRLLRPLTCVALRPSQPIFRMLCEYHQNHRFAMNPPGCSIGRSVSNVSNVTAMSLTRFLFLYCQGTGSASVRRPSPDLRLSLSLTVFPLLTADLTTRLKWTYGRQVRPCGRWPKRNPRSPTSQIQDTLETVGHHSAILNCFRGLSTNFYVYVLSQRPLDRVHPS